MSKDPEKKITSLEVFEGKIITETEEGWFKWSQEKEDWENFEKIDDGFLITGGIAGLYYGESNVDFAKVLFFFLWVFFILKVV